MTQAKTGDTVKVHYTGTLENGTVFDSSLEREPLEFTIGQGQLIPDFEQAIVGMGIKENKTINVQSENAYGPHKAEMIAKVERGQIPPDLKPQVGDQLQMQQPDGQTIRVIVVEADEATITLDANHPLAGKDLSFALELVEIIAPEAEA